jgi:cyclic pyranopterin phosphate synthase
MVDEEMDDSSFNDDDELTHIDESGAARMVDVSAKKRVKRTAKARGRITLLSETVDLIRKGLVEKGDVLAVARVAGIAAAKKTWDLIPLCHNIEIDHVSLGLSMDDDGIDIDSTAICTDKTGIEMEALLAVSVAALTIYDMCKAVDHEMEIGEIVLVRKTKEEL